MSVTMPQIGLTTGKWLWLAVFAPFRRFVHPLIELPSIAITPVYGRLGVPHGILQIKRYRPHNCRVGSNQIPFYPVQTWELLHYDNIICLPGQSVVRLRLPILSLDRGDAYEYIRRIDGYPCYCKPNCCNPELYA